MVDAWSTVVHREPEWDDYSRSEALALIAHDRLTCRTCLQHDSLRPIPSLSRRVRWGDGTVVNVEAYRCLGCMALALVERDQAEVEENDKPVPGMFAPNMGRRFTVADLT